MMEMMQSFNETILYIESVLEGTVDEKRIAHLSSYSYAMFSRLFSILTEMTLSEYIRSRKLTKAAVDLNKTNERILDIALKYGYESPDSFTNAFKAFHQVTPTDVRKGAPYRVVTPIQLTLSIKGGKTMDVRVAKKERFTVAGVKLENIDSSSCPKAWEALFAKCSEETLASLGSGQSYGMCFDVESEQHINYMACYDVTDMDKARAIGLDIVEISPAEYAVFTLEGAVPTCIHEGWKYAMEVFFPEEGYRHSGAPDFEVYSEGEMENSTYQMQLWIPIVKMEDV